MSEFCQLDRELAHISAVIASLKISAPLDLKSPVMDPAHLALAKYSDNSSTEV